MSDELKHELKSCPWCKYPPVLTNIIKDGTWYAECFDGECERHLRTAPLATKASAIDAWNLMVEEQAAHDGLGPDSNLPGLKRCELEETESYECRRFDAVDPKLYATRLTVHVLECSECGRTCEHINGTYPRCPYCSSVNVLDENYADDAPGQPVDNHLRDATETMDSVRAQIAALRAYYGAGKTTMTDEQIQVGMEHYNPALKYHMAVVDEIGESPTVYNAQGLSDLFGIWKSDESADEVDSREQLEADVRRYANPSGGTGTLGACWEQKMLEFLDRQDAITRREFDGECEFCQSEVARLQGKVDELTAEVEAQRKSANDAERGVLSEEWYICRDRYDDDVFELQQQVDSLTADAQQWADAANAQRLVAIEQADKVRDLTADLDKANEACDKLLNKLIDMTAERDYWHDEVQHCMDSAYPKSHAPERGYDQNVMAYPDRKGCTTPSTLVSAVIDQLRDAAQDGFYANKFGDVVRLTKERDEQRKRKSRAEQKLNALVNRLREQRVGIMWNDGISDWHVSLPIEEFAEVKAKRDELRERLDRIAAGFDDWDNLADGKEPPDCPMAQFQPRDGDSRDKLEADVADMVGAEPLYATIIGWLDRQEAITRAEVFEDGEYDCRTCAAKAELREQVDVLTAGHIRLQADLDEKQHVCDTQRESFRKMEQLLADAKAADYTAMRDEIEKLGERVAELETERRDLYLKIYGAPF